MALAFRRSQAAGRGPERTQVYPEKARKRADPLSSCRLLPPATQRPSQLYAARSGGKKHPKLQVNCRSRNSQFRPDKGANSVRLSVGELTTAAGEAAITASAPQTFRRTKFILTRRFDRRDSEVHRADLGPAEPAQGEAERNASPKDENEQSSRLGRKRSALKDTAAQSIIKRR